MDKLTAFTSEQLKETVPAFEIGDTVKVYNKIIEGTRERIQIFEGTVISKHGGGISESFTVRHVAYGCGVEKTFPIHSPRVDSVEAVSYTHLFRKRTRCFSSRIRCTQADGRAGCSQPRLRCS